MTRSKTATGRRKHNRKEGTLPTKEGVPRLLLQNKRGRQKKGEGENVVVHPSMKKNKIRDSDLKSISEEEGGIFNRKK